VLYRAIVFYFECTLLGMFFKGSGYRTIDGSLNLKPDSTIISCNVTVTHDENAVGLVETH